MREYELGGNSVKTRPILFNTEMVKAILDGRKTVTRRVVKHDIEAILNSPFKKQNLDVPDKQIIEKICKEPYEVGDILYVRETWSEWTGGYLYKAWTGPFPQPGGGSNMRWYPSIHMPKEAARIFLKVTGVRTERLRDITIDEIRKEGLSSMAVHAGDKEIAYKEWEILWDKTIKRENLDKYGWSANPWVWVIEFERC